MFKVTSLLIIALVVTGCSQRMGRFSVISEDRIPDSGLVLNKAAATTRSTSEECIHSYFLIPSRLSVPLPEIVHGVCKNKKPRYDAALGRSFWMIPFIYMRDCYQLEASCE